jgi:ABC-type polar amino acid transport system ATPase subunit
MTMVVVAHEVQLRARPQTVSCSWRKAASSRPEELMGNPRNERTRGFLRMVMGAA